MCVINTEAIFYVKYIITGLNMIERCWKIWYSRVKWNFQKIKNERLVIEKGN